MSGACLRCLMLRSIYLSENKGFVQQTIYTQMELPGEVYGLKLFHDPLSPTTEKRVLHYSSMIGHLTSLFLEKYTIQHVRHTDAMGELTKHGGGIRLRLPLESFCCFHAQK
jgi:hypothetical protein